MNPTTRYVTLTSSETELATQVARQRQAEAQRMGLRPKFGATDSSAASIHALGAAGELAAAKALGVAWQPTINTFKQEGGDGVGRLEVRTRSRHDFDLLVRPSDRDGRAFVHVTQSSTGHQVHGWLWSSEAKQGRWLQNFGGRPPAFFVPVSALRPLDTLPGLSS